MKRINQISVCVLSAALVLSPLAEARIGGGSGSRSSSSHSSYSSSSSSYSSSSSTRVGSGSSVGTSRADVMSKVRSGQTGSSNTYSSSSPGYSSQPAYSQPAQAQRSGPGWGTVAGAAAAAGAVGYLAGSHNSNNGGGYNNGNGYNGNNGANGLTGSYGNGTVAAPTQSSGGFGFGSFLLLALIIGGGIFLYRRYQSQNIKPAYAGAAPHNFGSSSAVSSSNSLSWQADSLFRDLQNLNNGSNPDQLREFCTPELYEQLQGSVGGNTSVISLRSELVDDSGHIASVRYQGSVSENGGPAENVDEVWHFVRNTQPGGREWLLAGIEQV